MVRVSGARARDAVAALCGRVPKARRASMVRLRDPRDGLELDQALVLWFPGPATATGEDIAEFHLHGGRAVVAAVTDALGALPGLRPAAPGEFTRRAFDNGRVDLAEAEGLGDLLAAETESQRRNALALAGGALSRAVERWRDDILMAAARVEAALDFADEDDVPGADAAIDDLVHGIADEIAAMLLRPAVERLRDGVRVVLAGPPNAGKSTLLNALVGRDAAIVSTIAGTTRDLIEAPVSIDGVPLVLIDTAGLREGGDAIEEIGIARAEAALAAADIVLWLGSGEQAPAGSIRVAAQCDVRAPDGVADLSVSAVTGEGMDALAALIVARARMLLPREGEIAFNARQREALGEAAAALQTGGASSDILLLAERLRLARVALDRLTGRSGVEDMLDGLFGRFCIGK